MILRDERPADFDAISAVTEEAFRTLAVSHHTEQFIVVALRAAGALAVSLVAEEGGRVVGHIAFSAVAVEDGSGGWYGLGPVSVLPALQGRGIGGALVREGLARIRGLGARGCFLVGEPGYYGRFGFASHPDLTCPGVPQAYCLGLALEGPVPRGAVAFHGAFAATA